MMVPEAVDTLGLYLRKLPGSVRELFGCRSSPYPPEAFRACRSAQDESQSYLLCHFWTHLCVSVSGVRERVNVYR